MTRFCIFFFRHRVECLVMHFMSKSSNHPQVLNAIMKRSCHCERDNSFKLDVANYTCHRKSPLDNTNKTLNR